MTITSVLDPSPSTSQSGGMPGWGIVADLTPPELLAARRLYVLRRLIAAGLVAIVVLCGAAFGYAVIQHSNASDDLLNASAQTTQLQAASTKYSGITHIEGAVDTIRGQVASVMQTDVDVPALIAEVRQALPGTMSIDNISMTLTPFGTQAAPSTGSLDTSGHAEIGTVTVSGSGRTLDDLPGFVDHLAALRGVVNVVPGSNSVSAGHAQFSLTFSLTDQLYSNRYAATSTGGN